LAAKESIRLREQEARMRAIQSETEALVCTSANVGHGYLGGGEAGWVAYVSSQN